MDPQSHLEFAPTAIARASGCEEYTAFLALIGHNAKGTYFQNDPGEWGRNILYNKIILVEQSVLQVKKKKQLIQEIVILEMFVVVTNQEETGD